MRPILLVLLLILTALPVLAQDAEDSFQPDTAKIFTNDPGALDPGQVEMQPSWQLTTGNRNFSPSGGRVPRQEYRLDCWSWQITYGVVENVDVNVTVGYNDALDRSNVFNPAQPQPGPVRGAGFADTTLGVRWEFSQDQDFSMAHLACLTVPNGVYSSPFQLGSTQGYASLAYQFVTAGSWGRFILNTDFGVYGALSGGPGRPVGGVIGNVAVGWQLVDWAQPLLEVNYQNLWSRNAPFSDTLAVTSGVMLYPFDNIRLNIGYQCPVAGHNAVEGKSVTFFVTWDL